MLKRIEKNNRGASVVAVIVVTALIGLFVASVMFTSLYNHQMRAAELLTQETFYTADIAMEEIRVGLTKYTSQAMADANLEVLEKYTATATPKETKDQFSLSFLDKLENKIADRNGQWNPELIKELTSSNLSSKIEILPENGNDIYRAKDNSSLTLRGVEIRYTDDNGYVSRVSTDITISVPEYGFNTDANLPDLARFSLIGQRGIVIEHSGVTIDGTSIFAGKTNVYSDTEPDNGYGLVLKTPGASVTFKNCPYIVSESKIDVANTGGNQSFGQADLTVSRGSTLWAEDINVYGKNSSVSLDGMSYIKDDTTVYGKDNSLKLSGQYFGYGLEDTNATGDGGTDSANKKSSTSAILVNGTGTKVDMSGLQTLVLTGNASIGVAANVSGVEGGQTQHVAMGESLAAKGGQLAYLAPPEMVGFNKHDNTMLGMNPIPENRYNEFKALTKTSMDTIAEEIVGEWIDINRPLPNMGGKTLKNDYGFTSTSDVYIYHDKTYGYAYVYLKFKDVQTAGAFFRDYYTANYESMDKYLGKYIKIRKENDTDKEEDILNINNNMFDPAMMGEFRVDVAGNILTKAETWAYGAFSIIDGFNTGDRKNETDATVAARNAEFKEYAGNYRNLCHKLTTAQITEEEATKTVFDNFINLSKVNTLEKYNNGRYDYFYTYKEKNDKGEVTERRVNVARVNFGSEVHIGAIPGKDKGVNVNNDDIKIVITTRDVYVHKNFDGIILSDGIIHIDRGVTITNENANLSDLLRATCVISNIPENMINGDPGDKEFELAELFNQDENWTPVVGLKNNPEEDELNPMKMITFTNWMRN